VKKACAVDQDLSALDGQNCGRGLQESRFSASVWSDDRGQSSVWKNGIQALQNLALFVSDAKLVQFNQDFDLLSP
jgi:hypothetical protein